MPSNLIKVNECAVEIETEHIQHFTPSVLKFFFEKVHDDSLSGIISWNLDLSLSINNPT